MMFSGIKAAFWDIYPTSKGKNYISLLIAPLTLGIVIVSYLFVLSFDQSSEWMFEHSACDHAKKNSLIQKYVTNHCGLTYVITWLILVTYAILIFHFFYVKNLVKTIQFLVERGLITKDSVLENLRNKTLFFILLGLFEFAFLIAWWSPTNDLYFTFIQGDFSGFITYFSIAIVMIPIGSACLSIIIWTAFIPSRIKLIKYLHLDLTKPHDFEGLKQLVHLSSLASLIVLTGITISLILYAPTYGNYRHLVISVVVWNSTIFFGPFTYVIFIIKKVKNLQLKASLERQAGLGDELIDLGKEIREITEKMKFLKDNNPYPEFLLLIYNHAIKLKELIDLNDTIRKIEQIRIRSFSRGIDLLTKISGGFIIAFDIYGILVLVNSESIGKIIEHLKELII